jgi:hypothetical protein
LLLLLPPKRSRDEVLRSSAEGARSSVLHSLSTLDTALLSDVIVLFTIAIPIRTVGTRRFVSAVKKFSDNKINNYSLTLVMGR